MAYVRHFSELLVYRQSRELAGRIFELTKKFPREETYSLTDQIRRSSRSIGAQIAEAWGKRNYEKHFVSKLTDADSEQLETQHWLFVAQDTGYISQAEAAPLLESLEAIGRMLNGMINKANQFCSPNSRNLAEDPAEYLIPQPTEYRPPNTDPQPTNEE